MKGMLNSIWLTGKQGLFHPQIIPNLLEMLTPASKEDWGLTLWTNTAQIQSSELAKLNDLNIHVQDHAICSNSVFYSYFKYFLELGINGDKSAFALASDVLRMCILELTPENEYFIYHDPNDVSFPHLEKSLQNLDEMMETNLFGLSFAINKLDEGLFELRNDLMIAKKSINEDFFKAYFGIYKNQLEKKYTTYKTPTTDAEAQELARTISNQITNDFFQILLTKPIEMVKATFGHYCTFYSLINCHSHFSYTRNSEYANTWLPNGLCLEEKREMEQFQLNKFSFLKDIKFSEVPTFFSKLQVNSTMDEKRQAEILKRFGRADGLKIIDIIEELGAEKDFRFYNRGIEVPLNYVSDIKDLQNKFKKLSQCGRVFPVKIIDNYIQVDCDELSNEYVNETLNKFSYNSTSFFSDIKFRSQNNHALEEGNLEKLFSQLMNKYNKFS